MALPANAGGGGHTPQWATTLLNGIFAPAVLGGFLVFAVNMYTASQNERDRAHDYQAAFVSLINDKIIGNANFANEGLPEAQRAAVTLLTLRSLAVSESERESLLLLAARLVAINPTPQTAEPAARVLTLFVQEIDNDLRVGRDTALNQRLHDLTRSPAFVSLVSSGIKNTYYADPSNTDRKYWTTLNGDEPVDRPALEQLLAEIGPSADAIDGWVNLATYDTHYDFRKAASSVSTGALEPAIAADFIAATTAVASGDLRRAGDVRSQYAIEAPAGAQLATTLLIDIRHWQSMQKGVLMLGPRLLRSDSPVVFINPDGTFREGSLGRVLGVVPPAACVEIIQPVRYLLVFMDSKDIAPQNGPDTWQGLIHVWAHVRASTGCNFAAQMSSA